MLGTRQCIRLQRSIRSFWKGVLVIVWGSVKEWYLAVSTLGMRKYKEFHSSIILPQVAALCKVWGLEVLKRHPLCQRFCLPTRLQYPDGT